MTSGPAGLSSKHGPELDLPGRFMVFAMTMLLVVALVSPWAYSLLLESFYAPHLLAFVHLNTLGVVAALLVGASYQLLPVVLQTPLVSVRLGRLSFWLYISGVVLFLPGIFATWRPGIAIGAALVFSGLLVYLLVVAGTLLLAPHADVVSWHIAMAMVGLGGGIAAGLLLALNKDSGFLGTATLRILAAHATLMLAGWVIVMLNGVAYRLVGMFTLSEAHLWHRVAWAELILSAGGAWVLAGGLLVDAPRAFLAGGAMLIVGGQALFGMQLLHLYKVRLRRGFDVHIPFALLAATSGFGGAVLLATGLVSGKAPSSTVWVSVGWLAISGVAITAMQGFFYKIATFLVWLYRYAPLAGRTRVPRLEDLYGRRLAKTGWVFWAAAMVISLAAMLLSSQPLATLAGTAAMVGLGCFLVNVTRIAAHVRPAQAENIQYAVRGRLSEVGKEVQIS